MDVMTPFHRPFLSGGEAPLVAEVIASGRFALGGPMTARCERRLESLVGCTRAILTTSCTDALEMMALLVDLEAGDEVILPSYTFVSTANAFVLRGAKCVFVDVDPLTMNIDPVAVEAAVTTRTKAVVAVHYGGVGCDMQALAELCRRRGLVLLEDAAQAIGAVHGGRPLGSFGAMAALSFHETKNIHCGEGGALLINDPRFVARAELLRDKGTDRARFVRGQIDKYTWQDIGSSFGPSELNAAFLLAQLEHVEAVTLRRRALWKRYRNGLAPLAEAGQCELASPHDSSSGNGHLFYLKARDEEQRTALAAHLSSAGISAVSHYVPLHSAPAGLRFGRFHGRDVATSRDSLRLLRLPLYPQLSDENVDRIAAETAAFIAGLPGTHAD
ncbi:MAG: dTDP-4-amino-4,6-dideoxygalactose transaminase [Pseudomonadota bacterium]|jgi:dTDP-4-amino-4,6-dideoxygalactose transaminase